MRRAMPTKKLTIIQIKAARAADKPYEIRDTEIKGLLVRVQPSGKKSFVCEYRANGRKTRTTIGDAIVIKLDAARVKARDVINAAAVKDTDHNEEKRKTRETQRISEASSLGVYLKDYWLPYAKKHIVTHETIYASLLRNFGDLSGTNIADICETDIERWRRRRANGKSPVTFETLLKDFGSLKAALNLAATEFKLLPLSPLQGYTLKRRANNPEPSNEEKVRYLVRGVEDVRLREALTARDSKIRAERESANRWRRDRGRELLPAIGTYGDHVTPIVLLSLNTGLDRGDLFDLTAEHIDLRHNHIRKQRNKTSHKGRPRVWTLPLSLEARTILDTWLKETGIKTGRVFPSPVTGGRLTDIKKAWMAILKDAKLIDFRFKDLRHTFASWLAMDGADLNTIRELMCHTDIKTTLIYAHLSPDHKAEAVASAFDNQG